MVVDSVPGREHGATSGAVDGGYRGRPAASRGWSRRQRSEPGAVLCQIACSCAQARYCTGMLTCCGENRWQAGNSPLHYAARHKEDALTRQLLAAGADARAKCDRGFTPLHYAAFEGAVSPGMALLERGAVVNAVNDKGYTALHVAAEHHQVRSASEALVASARRATCALQAAPITEAPRRRAVRVQTGI